MSSTIKTYLINLEHRLDRREKALSQLENFPALDVEVCKAVYGKALSDEEKTRLMEFSKDRVVMSDGELGCALSHRKCYEMLLQTNAPYALILEDDIIIGDLFPESLDLAVDTMRQQTSPYVVLFGPRALCSRVARFHSENVSLHKVYDATHTTAYIINRCGAQCMLDKGNPSPIRYVADNWYHFIHKGLNVFSCVPHTISFPDEFSCSDLDIERRSMYEHFISGKSAWSLWRRWRDTVNSKRMHLAFCRRILCAKEYSKTW